jgi:hypothetical protein
LPFNAFGVGFFLDIFDLFGQVIGHGFVWVHLKDFPFASSSWVIGKRFGVTAEVLHKLSFVVS